MVLKVGVASLAAYWGFLLVASQAQWAREGEGLATAVGILLALLAVQLVCIFVAAVSGQLRERLASLALGVLWYVTAFVTLTGGSVLPA